MAQHPWVCAGVIASASLSICCTVAAVRGVPAPMSGDEFSYLLASDTFAHGRCANPTHPLWPHFETFHVLQRPTYVSKYPPAQGMTLAAAQLTAGLPIIGVWVTVTLACLSVYWMLLAWLPARWALCGGLIAFTRLVICGSGGYWSQSYWGGAVAAFAGSLVL